jgi:hypothetical protein
MRIAIAGKGGVGKSVIAATMARILARRGVPVLAINSDLMPVLPSSLGVAQSPWPTLTDAVVMDGERWHLRKGIGRSTGFAGGYAARAFDSRASAALEPAGERRNLRTPVVRFPYRRFCDSGGLRCSFDRKQ